MKSIPIVLAVLCAMVASQLSGGGVRADGIEGWSAPTVQRAGTATGAPLQLAVAQSIDRPPAAEFTATYTAAPAGVVAAVEHALSIAERLVASDAEVTLTLTWEPMAMGSLAGTFVAWRMRDGVEDPGLPIDGVLYPAALANAIRGNRLDERADMRVSINSELADKLYLGTDGLPPDGSFDLVTVVLHEVLHGLGIASNLDPSSERIPSVFDTFLRGSDGRPVASLSGADLASQLTGDALAFAGPDAMTAAGGRSAPIFAPADFDFGASVSHLDAEVYAAPNDNHLMEPGTPPGWAVHDPGPIVMAMLRDIGWEIPGLGEPARLGVSSLPTLVGPALAGSFELSISVLDPIGALVRDDNLTVVSLFLYSFETADTWGCAGEHARTVSDGVARYTLCEVDVGGPIFFGGESTGLAPGNSRVSWMVDEDVLATHLGPLARSR